MSHNNSYIWELALVAQALTNKKEELQKEYKETKNEEIIEELYKITHNLRLVNKQLARTKK